MKAGVLALQGDVEEHIQAFKKAAQELGISIEVIQVKKPQDLREIATLAIPGGESTTIGALAKRTGLLDVLRDAIKEGLPTLGTCAGAIFLAKEVRDSVVGETKQPILGLMDIAVIRNAFGRQRESFEVDLQVGELGTVRAVFIRAPAFIKAWGDARLAASLKHPELGQIYAAAFQGHMVATAFHPELSTTVVHKYMLNLAKK